MGKFHCLKARRRDCKMRHSTCYYLGSMTIPVWCLLRHWGSHCSPVTVLHCTPFSHGDVIMCMFSFSECPAPTRHLSRRHMQNFALWSFLRCLSCYHLYPLSSRHGDKRTPLWLTSCIVSIGTRHWAQIPKRIWDSFPSPPTKSFGPGDNVQNLFFQDLCHLTL